MMKAAVLHANMDVRYEDYPTPVCGAGEVLVRVHMTGICGSDIPRVLYNGAHNYPIVLGHEFSGVVEQVGEGVKRVKVGDHVSGAPLLPCMECPDCQRGNFSLCKHYSFIGSRQQGSFAEYVVLPERNAIVYDPAIPFEQAAFFEPSTVALHGLTLNDYRGGGHVAILGGGTIGLFTAQWARIYGAADVTVLDVVPERLELARKLGATYTVNTTEPDFREQCDRITGGRGFDYTFETAGAVPTMHMAFELAGNRSHVTFIGTPHKEITFTAKEWELLNRKEFKMTGSWMSYSAPFPGSEWELTAHYFANGQLRYDPALIFRKFALEDTMEAFKLYTVPGAVQGKLMLEVTK